MAHHLVDDNAEEERTDGSLAVAPQSRREGGLPPAWSSRQPLIGLDAGIEGVRAIRQLLKGAIEDHRLPFLPVHDLLDFDTDGGIGTHPRDFLSLSRAAIEMVVL